MGITATNLLEKIITNWSWQIFILILVVIFRSNIIDILKNFSLLIKNFSSIKKIKVNTPPFIFETHTEIETLPEIYTNSEIENSTSANPEKGNTDINQEKKEYLNDIFRLMDDGDFSGSREAFELWIRETKHEREEYLPGFLKMLYLNNYSLETILELKELSRTAVSEDDRVSAARDYADCLCETQEFDKALTFLHEFKLQHKEPLSTMRISLALAEINFKNGDKNSALTSCKSIINDNNPDTHERSSSILSYTYKLLADIAESDNDYTLQVFCLDKAAQHTPLDTSNMFDAGYASKKNEDAIAIANYAQVLKINNTNGAAANNLGVIAMRHECKTVGTKLYSKGEENGISLAASNKGELLLEAGFAVEAQALSDKALMASDVNKSVHALIKQIQDKTKNEDERWESLKEKSFKIQKKIRIYTEKYFKEKYEFNEHTSWRDSNNIFIIDNKEGILTFTCDEDDKITIISGIVTGHSFKGNYSQNKKKKKSETSLTLLSLSSESKSLACLGYIDSSTNSISFFSNELNTDLNISLKLTAQENITYLPAVSE